MDDGITRRSALGALAAVVATPRSAVAQPNVVRVMIQYGISYLPLMVMEDDKLLEKAASDLGHGGVELKVQRMSGSTAINDALIAGNADLGVMGVPSLLIISEKTRGGVKGLASTSSFPMVLNSVAPNLKRLADVSQSDRIAMPASTSPQNFVLRMAAERIFGDARKLDTNVVALPHPEAMSAMLAGTEITAHFTNAPFAQFEADDKRVHRVMASTEILGGNATFVLLAANSAWVKAHPEIATALVQAMDEAMKRIRVDPAKAAAIYLKYEPSKMKPEFVEAILRDPENVFTTAPNGIMAYADFMHRTGQLKSKLDRWQDVFHPQVHGRSGS